MWSTDREVRERRIAATGDGCVEAAHRRTHTRVQKLSRSMAMLLGAFVTLEIMVAGAMLFNFDFAGADAIAIIFAFLVLYFGVVAMLTDR